MATIDDPNDIGGEEQRAAGDDDPTQLATGEGQNSSAGNEVEPDSLRTAVDSPY